ncbi:MULTISPECIES: methionyl-tRNA formyltransferase [unclassified Paenibacillus]|uniref:methionyl-tRNA formyltransferase n=1 Tax=unclassified Paenibacillus TaxID=185978 RepID=UPI001AE82F05|nr:MULTISPECIES: methionyl-tRNA formyltransferase [unclassified Paenibacillus]MBP1156093.1 methionyl-tRNA formyltransferase [Paenibacillus sp. PvP091]MBP1168521.1 methionyl-tRNA formyltransferase [Paenibacillus sp. PvR098]MBP2439549.1 methionyl-tRNA formyltransferase [Paenibacillus sp. PvP052]
MRVIFMGTPEFAVPSLQILLKHEEVEVVAVVTQPDRPVGRKRVLTPTPVKAEAEKHGLPVLQPERLRSPESVQAISALQPDLIVTAAYGQILPKSVLDLPRFGCINIHASLLPQYRGGAPIHYAVMNGESVTGVTIMYMAEGLDTGDMISKIEVPIEDRDTTGTMFGKLSAAGAKLLEETLPDLISGTAKAVPQNDEEAVYSPNISREQERIDWTKPAIHIWNLVRALHPRPGAFTLWKGDVLKIWACAKPDTAEPVPSGTIPGTVLEAGDRGIAVATGQGVLRITELQPAGKKTMDAADFVRGGQLTSGTVLGI